MILTGAGAFPLKELSFLESLQPQADHDSAMEEVLGGSMLSVADQSIQTQEIRRVVHLFAVCRLLLTFNHHEHEILSLLSWCCINISVSHYKLNFWCSTE